MVSVEEQVRAQILEMEKKKLVPVAVLIGHEDWLYFTEQSKVAYTPFGSARRYQPALGGLLLVRVDEMHRTQVVTQDELGTYQKNYQTLS